MKYGIITLGDIHWDAFDIPKQKEEMTLPLNVIKDMKHLDLVVIAGDYYDSKLSLNSKAAKAAIDWMAALVSLCKERNTKIRMIKGTNSHDNNQLEIFRPYEKESIENNNDFFRIYNEVCIEETLPGMKCLYAPDENIASEEYYKLHQHEFFKNAPMDIMFFHGTFDIVAPNIAVQESELEGIKSIIFKYAYFANIVTCMVGGHWHDGEEIDDDSNMYYTRSVSRWSFGEEKPKGFLYTVYDTFDRSYAVKRIENPFTDTFTTLTVDTKSLETVQDYKNLIESVKYILSDDKAHVRLKISLSDEKVMNDNGIDLLRRTFREEKRLKIVIKDYLKEVKNKEDRKKTKEIKDKFSFVMDPSKSPAEIIHEFILITKKKDIPVDVIHLYIDKYMSS